MIQLSNTKAKEFVQTSCEQINTNSILTKDKINSIDICFENISYSVQIPQENSSVIPFLRTKREKHILNGISGIFKAGTVTAIMGASGAGKTTLLNILACRVNSNISGKLYANREIYDFQKFGDFANYVMQKDVLMETLTVRQTLDFACSLKNITTQDQKKQKIINIAKQLKLEKCLDTKIGGVIEKGISGGQRKRTSIGFQLISDPQVLMLDQPTSGLDSLTSYIIVCYLQKLAHLRNRTIITTIHQPNDQIFALFDNLILLAEGRIVYQGKSSLSESYFQKNFMLSCPQFTNPADYFMSVLHHQKQQNVKRYPILFQTYTKQLAPQINNLIQNRHTQHYEQRKISIPFCQSFGALVYRNLLTTVRNPILVKSRFLQTIFLSLYVGGIYWNIGGKDYQNAHIWTSITGLLFFLCINSLMMSLAPIALTFPLERDVFLRQQNSKMYGVSQYFLSRNVVQIPYLVIFPFLTALIMYWMINLSSSAEQFFIFYFIVFLVSFAGNSLGLFLGSVINDAKSVSSAIPMVILPFILFSGFFKNRADLPAWIGWIQYISPIKYSFIGFLQNEVKYVNSNIGNLNFDVSQWSSIGILIGLGIAFRLFSWIALDRLKSRQQ